MLCIVLTLLLFQQVLAWNIKNYVNLRNIVISSALMTTITKRINNELINETLIMNDITNINSHSQQMSILFDSLLVLLLVTQYKSMMNYDEKLLDVQLYYDTQKSANKFILVSLFVFTRNIENAI
jgi:hypothetical protein